MYTSNLINILKTFSKKDVREFGKYVHSPFFNSNENTVKLFEFMKDFFPDFTHKRLDKELAYKAVFKTEQYNSGLMTTTMFQLTNLAKGYMSYVNFSTNEINGHEYLLKELRNRSLDKIFEKEFREAFELVEKWGGIDNDYLQHRLNLGSVFHDYYEAKNRSDEELMQMLTASAENLLAYFLMISEIMLTGFEARKNKFNAEPERRILEEFFKHVNIDGFNESISSYRLPVSETIMLNLLIIQNTLKQDNFELYLKFKKSLFENIHLYSSLERYILLAGARNLLLQQRSLDPVVYQTEYFELLEKMLEYNAYKIFGGHMSLSVFDNFLTSALALNKVEWARQFVENHVETLVPAVRDNMKQYAFAKLAYQKGELDKALGLASNLNMEPIVQKVRLKVLQMKIYFEKKDYESVLYAADSFRHFLRYNKNISPQRRADYSELMKFLFRLIKCITKPDKQILEKLKLDVISSIRVANREWLLEKINETETEPA